jgi:hypothetical protein
MRNVRTAALDAPARLRESLRGTSLYLNAFLDVEFSCHRKAATCFGYFRCVLGRKDE